MLFSRIKTVLLLWCVAEVVVFVVLIHVVGFLWTAIAAALTSAVGISLLKRTGAATLIQLRSSFRGRLAGAGTNAELIDSALTVLGALALTVPGFLSNFAGLALLTRPLRDRLAHNIRGGRWSPLRPGGPDSRRPPNDPLNSPPKAPQRGPDVIDLSPDQWREAESRRGSELHP